MRISDWSSDVCSSDLHGVCVTFSMSTKVWGWLPQSLAFGTPLESGRIAYIPEIKSLYSLYTTKNEKGEERRVKTLSSAFQYEFTPDAKMPVSFADARRSAIGREHV